MRLPQHCLTAALFAGAACFGWGCNTFGETMTFQFADAGTSADADAVDVGASDASGDLASIDMDTAPDMREMFEPNWSAEPTPAPDLDPAEVAEELRACGPAIQVSSSIGTEPELHVTTVVVDDLSQNVVVSYVDLNNRLNVRLLDDTEMVDLFRSDTADEDTSTFQVAARDDGPVVDDATIGAQLLVAALTTDDRVALVQCSFQGPPICRVRVTDIAANTLALGSRGNTFYLYTVDDSVQLLEHRINTEDLRTTPEILRTPEGLAYRAIETGVSFASPILVLAVDSSEGTHYEVASYVQGRWSDFERASATAYPNLTRPDSQILHESRSVSVVADDQGVFRQFDSLRLNPQSMWETAVLAENHSDVAFSPIVDGFAEIFVSADGTTKVGFFTFDGDAFGPDAGSFDGDVRDQDGDILRCERPARVTVATATPVIVTRQTDSLMLYPLCADM